MPELETVGTQDLVDELKKRFSCLLLVGLRAGKREGSSLYSTFTDGDLTQLLGLATRVQAELLETSLDVEEADEEDIP